jgi:hypothetical protein
MNMWKPINNKTKKPESSKAVSSILPPETPLVFFVIYTCRKNLAKAQRLYEWVKDKIPALTVFILYGDIKIKEEYEIKPPFLIVKTGDAYEHLPQKTLALFHAISEMSYYENYRGMIKCDDDILPNLASLQQFYEHLVSSEVNLPYAGLLLTINEEKRVSNQHFDKCSSPKYNIPQPIIPNCPYATGPMYYLSIPSIMTLERKHQTKQLNIVFYEDMMVGANLRNQGIYPVEYPLYQNELSCSFQAPSIQDIDKQARFLYVLLQGGLGNQMFQLASAYGMARDSGRYLVALYTQNREHYPHQSSAQEYTHSLFRNTPCVMATPEMFQTPAIEIYSELGEQLSKGFEYHSEILLSLKPDKDILLQGYFQNEQYFSKYREEILAEWQYPLLAQRLQETYPNLAQSYFFHIRRGDYMGNPLFEMDWDNYYSRALDTILELEMASEHIQFYVFSDDNEFCKSYRVFTDYLKEQPKITFTLIENLGAMESLIFMSQCGGGGIATNSTFSWWGGYLNPKPDKLIILPKQWLQNTDSIIDMKFEGSITL